MITLIIDFVFRKVLLDEQKAEKEWIAVNDH